MDASAVNLVLALNEVAVLLGDELVGGIGVDPFVCCEGEFILDGAVDVFELLDGFELFFFLGNG